MEAIAQIPASIANDLSRIDHHRMSFKALCHALGYPPSVLAGYGLGRKTKTQQVKREKIATPNGLTALEASVYRAIIRAQRRGQLHPHSRDLAADSVANDESYVDNAIDGLRRKGVLTVAQNCGSRSFRFAKDSGKIALTCDHCGVEFQRKRSDVDERYRHHYCGTACYWASRRTRKVTA